MTCARQAVGCAQQGNAVPFCYRITVDLRCK
jgi:hypothetical protein